MKTQVNDMEEALESLKRATRAVGRELDDFERQMDRVGI